MRFLCLCFAAVLLASCGTRDQGLEALETRDVTLPNGRVIRAEVMLDLAPIDMQRGMMFRDSLAPDRGMLFIHSKPGLYTYWMYQVKIPLDIIWMDQNRRIVEISTNTPPCKTVASQCPTYGGHEQSRFVLELAGGEVARNGLRVGQILVF